MPWVKLDDSWYDSPKFAGLGLHDVGLWAVCLSWCARHLTDGHIPTGVVARIIPHVPSPGAELVTAGLWDKVPGGWQIHDYLDYQPSADHVRIQRAKRADAGRAGGVASGQTRRSDAQSKQTGSKSFVNRSHLLEPPYPSRTPEGQNTCPKTAAKPNRPPTRQVAKATKSDFEQFYAAWPRKVGRPKAETAYNKAIKAGATADQILTGARRWAQHYAARGTCDWCPHPTTWLNRDGWNDNPPADAAPTRPDRNGQALDQVVASLADALTPPQVGADPPGGVGGPHTATQAPIRGRAS